MQSNKLQEEGKCFGLRNQIAILVEGTIVPGCLDQEGDIDQKIEIYEMFGHNE